MGYCYLEPTIQTAVYTIKYVHNGPLQIALDIGIIPMVLFVITIVKNIISKDQNITNKLLIIVIVVHGLLDIDLQYISIFMILIMLCNNQKAYKDIKIKDGAPICKYFISSVIIIVYTYFSIALISEYFGNYDFSLKMYGKNTEAKVKYLKQLDINKNSNKIANEILQQNENISYAHYVKSQYSFKNKEWKEMEESLLKIIDLDKYNMQNYDNYILMMSKALEYEIVNNNLNLEHEYANKIIEVEEKIKILKQNTSRLAYKINDKPNFELSEETAKYLQTLKEQY